MWFHFGRRRPAIECVHLHTYVYILHAHNPYEIEIEKNKFENDKLMGGFYNMLAESLTGLYSTSLSGYKGQSCSFGMRTQRLYTPTDSGPETERAGHFEFLFPFWN
jgi:hypothetical protein